MPNTNGVGDAVEETFNAFIRMCFLMLLGLSLRVIGPKGFLTQCHALGPRVELLTSPVFPRVAIDERLR